jgi:hypothetical protein
MCDGATSGFCLNRGEQVVLVTWYYPPEEWRPLAEWYRFWIETVIAFYRQIHGLN